MVSCLVGSCPGGFRSSNEKNISQTWGSFFLKSMSKVFLQTIVPPHLPSFTIQTHNQIFGIYECSVNIQETEINTMEELSLPVKVVEIRELRIRRWREEHFLVDGYIRRRDFGFLCIMLLSILYDWFNNFIVHLSASQQHWWLFQPQQTLYTRYSGNRKYTMSTKIINTDR